MSYVLLNYYIKIEVHNIKQFSSSKNWLLTITTNNEPVLEKS